MTRKCYNQQLPKEDLGQNSLVNMMKNAVLTGVLALAIFVLAGCGVMGKAGNETTFNAKIIQMYPDSVIVEPLDGEDILHSADVISFGTAGLDDIGVAIGDIVAVTYNGMIREIYPATIDVIKWSMVEKSIPMTYVPYSKYFEAYYYRSDLSRYVEAIYPIVTKISSVNGLHDYYSRNRDTYQIDVGHDGATGSMAEGVFFNSAVFNEAFFDDAFLLFIVLEEGSRSVRHIVSSVKQEGGILSVNITRLMPQIGTADMAQWHVILVLDKSFLDMDIGVTLTWSYL